MILLSPEVIEVSLVGKMEHAMNFLSPLGRLLFSLIFITAAPRHFTHEGIEHAMSLGVPAAVLLVPLSGVLAFAGGISIAIGLKAKWGAWALIVFLLPVTLWMHAFWRLSDPAAIHIQSGMFAKNLSMLGAALLIAQFGAGSFSIDSLRNRWKTQLAG